MRLQTGLQTRNKLIKTYQITDYKQPHLIHSVGGSNLEVERIQLQEDTDTFAIGTSTSIKDVLRSIGSQRQLIESQLHPQSKPTNTHIRVNHTRRVRQPPSQERLSTIEAQSSLDRLQTTVGR